MFKLRFDDAGRHVYLLPQDVIDNTIAAFNTSPTSPTGYAGTPPTGRYFAPANSPTCLETATGFGDCGARSVIVTGPLVSRVDLSIVKQVPIHGRVNFEYQLQIFNLFNRVNFTAPAANRSVNTFGTITSTFDARQVQLGVKVLW